MQYGYWKVKCHQEASSAGIPETLSSGRPRFEFCDFRFAHPVHPVWPLWIFSLFGELLFGRWIVFISIRLQAKLEAFAGVDLCDLSYSYQFWNGFYHSFVK